MRRHFVFQVSSFLPSPAGCGTIEDWLEFYKLDVSGETYVRMDYDGVPAVKGDILWFQVDDRVLACTTVYEMRPDEINGGQEFWYLGEEVRRVHSVHIPPQNGALVTLLGEQWLRFLDPPSHAAAGGG